MTAIQVGLLGLGTVGSGVALTLEKNRKWIEECIGCPVRITRALVKNKNEYGHLKLPDDLTITENVRDILDDEAISIIIEVMGGIHPAREFILEALTKKKNVVSANKDLIAMHGPEIVRTATENGVDFLCEASVGGGMPILLPLQKSLKANQVEEIAGIVNGTTNYILSAMTEDSLSYEEALAQAQLLGYAEANPAADVGGLDAARKIAILSSIAYRSKITLENVQVEGIEKITARDIQVAGELGYVIKLLAVAKKMDEGVVLSVHPAFVPVRHPLAAVRGAYNAVYVVGNAVDDVMFYGKGAGSFPTASAVLGDVMEIAHHINENICGKNPILTADASAKLADAAHWKSPYYFRLIVQNRPGVLAEISQTFSQQGISIETMRQLGEEVSAELVMVVYPAEQRAVHCVRSQLEGLESVERVANVIRVFEDQSDE